MPLFPIDIFSGSKHDTGLSAAIPVSFQATREKNAPGKPFC